MEETLIEQVHKEFFFALSKHIFKSVYPDKFISTGQVTKEEFIDLIFRFFFDIAVSDVE